MEQKVINLLPYLLWAGYILHMINNYFTESIPFTWKTAEGKKNIKSTIFGGLLVAVIFPFALIIEMDNKINTSTYQGVVTLILWVIGYLSIGWAMVSLFMASMKKGEDTILDRIHNHTGDNQKEGDKTIT